jgi:protocatechuate 3,4-dioxygenase beta subunit
VSGPASSVPLLGVCAAGVLAVVALLGGNAPSPVAAPGTRSRPDAQARAGPGLVGYARPVAAVRPVARAAAPAVRGRRAGGRAPQRMQRTLDPENPCALRVLVRDAQDRPVPGARVEVRVRGALLARESAGPDGRRTLEGLPGDEAPWNVRAVAPGFRPDAEDVPDPAPGHFARVALRLRPATRLVGRALDEDGRPVGGLWVEAVSSVGPQGEAARRTGVDGSFGPLWIKPRAEAGPAKVLLAVRSMQSSWHACVAAGPSGDGLRTLLRVKRHALGRRIRGRVRDPSGAPVAGARVRFLSCVRPAWPGARREAADAPAAGRTRTDAQGRFALYVARPFVGCTTVKGIGSLVASARGYADAAWTLPRSDRDLSVTLRLGATRSLGGIVRYRDGEPAAGAVVVLRAARAGDAGTSGTADAHAWRPEAEPAGRSLRRTVADADGRYVFRDAPADRPLWVHACCGYRRIHGGHVRWRAWCALAARADPPALVLPVTRARARPGPPDPDGDRDVTLVLADGDGCPLSDLAGRYTVETEDGGGTGTFEDGRIHLGPWPAGATRLALSGDPCGSAKMKVRIPGGGGEIPVRVTVPAGPGVRARLLPPPGYEPEDLRLSLVRGLDDEGQRTLALGADGLRRARRVAPGAWRLAVEEVGGGDFAVVAPAVVHVGADGVRDVDVRVVPAVAVDVEASWPRRPGPRASGPGADEPEPSLRVLDGEGRLRAWEELDTQDDASGPRVQAGAGLVLAPGSYRLVLRVGDRTLASRDVRVGAGMRPVRLEAD